MTKLTTIIAAIIFIVMTVYGQERTLRYEQNNIDIKILDDGRKKITGYDIIPYRIYTTTDSIIFSTKYGEIKRSKSGRSN